MQKVWIKANDKWFDISIITGAFDEENNNVKTAIHAKPKEELSKAIKNYIVDRAEIDNYIMQGVQQHFDLDRPVDLEVLYEKYGDELNIVLSKLYSEIDAKYVEIIVRPQKYYELKDRVAPENRNVISFKTIIPKDDLPVIKQILE